MSNWAGWWAGWNGWLIWKLYWSSLYIGFNIGNNTHTSLQKLFSVKISNNTCMYYYIGWCNKTSKKKKLNERNKRVCNTRITTYFEQTTCKHQQNCRCITCPKIKRPKICSASIVIPTIFIELNGRNIQHKKQQQQQYQRKHQENRTKICVSV